MSLASGRPRARVDLLLPGDPSTPTGGYVYDARVFDGLAARGWAVRVHRLSDRFPRPDRAALEHADRVLGAVPDGRTVVVDGLALGAMPSVARAHGRRLRLVGLVHHPLAAETGLSRERAEQARREEREALAATSRVVVTSPSTARSLGAYGVATARISVVAPGTDPAPLAAGSAPGEPPELLCVATLTPRKGHAVLLDALAAIRARPWRLTCAGSADRCPETAARLREQRARLGLEGRVHLLGEVDAGTLAACYAGADLFVLATFHEGYGMAFAEALARGLPVVGTDAGAVRDTVPEAARLLVPRGDRDALRTALVRVLDDAGLRARLAAGARAARSTLASWDDASDAMARALLRAADG